MFFQAQNTIGTADDHPPLDSSDAASPPATASVRSIPLDSEVMVVSLLKRDAASRRRAEAFIADRYEAQFGARIAVSYPLLLCLTSTSGEMLAAVGLRCAGDGPLFLEQYLDQPIDLALGACWPGPHRRDRIVELGSLASVNNGASLYLVAAMAAYMEVRGFEVATVTGTRRLRRLFELFDFNFVTLGSARRDRLIDASANWGSYYDDDPQILAGQVRQCFEAAVLRARVLSAPSRGATLDGIISQVRELV